MRIMKLTGNIAVGDPPANNLPGYYVRDSMKKRRGLSEVIGGIIIILAMVAASLAITSTMNRALHEANRRISTSIDTLLDQSNPIMILPYVINRNGDMELGVYISPVDDGESIEIYLVSGNNTVERRLVSNGTSINATVLKSYDCNPVYIVVERSSGAIYTYNALRDPRVEDYIHVGDPRLFSCSLINNTLLNSVGRDELTGLPLIGLQPPNPTSNTTIKLNKRYSISLKGFIEVGDNNTKKCSLTITLGNKNWSLDSCSESVLLDETRSYSLHIKFNKTRRTVYGYLEITPSVEGSLITARVYSEVHGKRRYLTYPPNYKTFGSLENTHLPIIYAPVTEGVIHSRTQITSKTYYFDIELDANSTASITTTGPIIFLISTNKLENYRVGMTIDLVITDIIVPTGIPITHQLGKTRQMTVEAHSILKAIPGDYIAEVLNSVKNRDWNIAWPTLKVAWGNRARSIEIEQGSTIRLYSMEPFTAMIELRAGYNLPPLSSYNLTQTVWSSGERYGYLLNGNTLMKPVASQAHLPYIIEVTYNDTSKYFIAGSDYKLYIPVQELTFPDTSQKWILYTFGLSRINLSPLNASLGCVLDASTNNNSIVSMVMNPTIKCSSKTLKIRPQNLYLIILADFKGQKLTPRALIYRLLWNS